MTEATCVDCREQFMRRGGRGRPRKRCERCSPPAAGPRLCKDCGEVYEPWCQWKHPGAAGRRCHPCYLAYSRHRQSGSEASKRPLLTHGAKPSGTRWRSLQEEVWASETVCGFCGEYVDQSLPTNDSKARSVDHIVPIALGGAMYDRTNVRLAHRGCNSRAGAQSVEGYLLLRAAVWMAQRL